MKTVDSWFLLAIVCSIIDSIFGIVFISCLVWSAILMGLWFAIKPKKEN